MREIPLTRGLVALVDDDDYEMVAAAGSWNANVCDGRLYARRRFLVGRHTLTVSMHTFITGYRLVDHINGDGLDNQQSNLRAATPQQNSQNSRRQTRTASGYKGVYLHRRSGLYAARIVIQGRAVSLRYHKTPEDAARAYDAAAIEHFGEFANTNFPREDYAA